MGCAYRRGGVTFRKIAHIYRIRQAIFLFIPRHTLVAGYYVFTLAVRVSVRPSVRPPVRPSVVHMSVRILFPFVNLSISKRISFKAVIKNLASENVCSSEVSRSRLRCLYLKLYQDYMITPCMLKLIYKEGAGIRTKFFSKGRSAWAMKLDKFHCRGVLQIWIIFGQGPTGSKCGWVLFRYSILSPIISHFFPPCSGRQHDIV